MRSIKDIIIIAIISVFSYPTLVYSAKHEMQKNFGKCEKVAQNVHFISSAIYSFSGNGSKAQSQQLHISYAQNSTCSTKYKKNEYDSIGQYGTSGLALVKMNDKFGFIGKDSTIVIPVIFDDVFSMLEAVPGTITAEVQKRWNVKWSWTWDKGQLMSVCKNGKWGYLDESGKEVIPIIYDDVCESIVFKNRPLIGVAKNGKYGFVNHYGEEIIPLHFDLVSRFYLTVDDWKNDMVSVVKDGKLGFINGLGEAIIPFLYEPIYDADFGNKAFKRPVWFHDKTSLKKDGKWGVIDRLGNTIVDFQSENPVEIGF